MKYRQIQAIKESPFQMLVLANIFSKQNGYDSTQISLEFIYLIDQIKQTWHLSI